MITCWVQRKKEIFASVFDTDDIDMDTSISDIDDWDSFKHIELIATIEKEFAMQFSFSEIVELTSINSILIHLKNKGVLR